MCDHTQAQTSKYRELEEAKYFFNIGLQDDYLDPSPSAPLLIDRGPTANITKGYFPEPK